jgi:hypothetical protein
MLGIRAEMRRLFHRPQRGANPQKNKLDTPATHHPSASYEPFARPDPPPQVPRFSPRFPRPKPLPSIHAELCHLSHRPQSGANTGKNKLDTNAMHHLSASYGRFARPDPPPQVPRFSPRFPRPKPMLSIHTELCRLFHRPQRGANTGKNKLDTHAMHHPSASYERFARPAPPPQVPMFSPRFPRPKPMPSIHAELCRLSHRPQRGANTGKNKLDTLATHHPSASYERFARPDPPPNFTRFSPTISHPESPVQKPAQHGQTSAGCIFNYK